jgi:hypothetical protein
MHIVKSVGVMSVAKVMGVLYAALGLLFVPFFLLAGLIGSVAGQKSPMSGIAGLGFGVGMAIFMPFLYGALGFVFGALGAFLYNVVAKRAGGFELELAQMPAGPYAPYPVVPPAAPTV